MNKRKKFIYFAFTLSLLTVFSVVMLNLEAFEEKKEFLNKGNEVSTKKVVENTLEDIKETLYSKAVTEESPTVEEKPNIVDNIVPNVKQVVNSNDNNNIKDNTITSPPEAKPAEKEEVPTIILEDSNVYVQELGEPKNELAMQVITKDKNIEYGVDDSKVDYSKVGKYSVRFFARTFATNRQVEKVMPFAVVDTKAPIIAIVPERTVDAASSVAVRLNIKDPSAITEKKYVWLNENDPIPADNDPLWIAMTAEDQVVETKDFNAVKEGTLSIAVQALDNTNNKATVKSQEYQLSQHVPADIVMQPSTTDFTNQDVKLTITYQNTPTRQKYKVQGQSWKDYTGEINITDNCYVYAQGTNGNKIAKKILNITNIDKKGPENIVIAPNLCLAQSANLKVDITVTDDISGFRTNTPTDIQYKWVQKGTDPASISWKSPTTPISIINNQKTVSFSETNSVDKGIYLLHVKATDYAGNAFTKVSGEYNLCNYSVLPPTLSAAPSTGWVKDKVVVTITPKDAEETVYYSLDENAPKDTWTKYTNPIDITENKTVWAYAKSAANVDSAASSISIANIDKTVPTVSIDTDNTVPYKSIEASITATDLGGSNIKEINYAWVEISITNVPENGWTALSPIGNILPAYGTDISSAKRLFVKVIDNAGNAYVTYKDYTLDNTAPVVNITTDNTKPLKSVTVQTTATDANEVAKKEYIWTDELATKPTTGYTAYATDTLPIYSPGTTGNKKVWIKVTDKAGNVAEASKVFKIDNTAPTISITTANDVPYKVVAPRFTKTDNLSIVTNIQIYYQWTEENAHQPTQNYIQLTLDNIPDYNNANTSGKKTLWIQAIDEANNISYVNKTFTIDNTNPVITVSSKDLKTNKITVHASVTDNVDTVTNTNLKLRYKKNVDQAYTEISADSSGNIQIPNLTHNTLYNLELTYTDKAGNVATVTDTATTLLLDTPVISIDKTDANWYKQKTATIDYKSYKDNVTYKYKKDNEAEIVPSISAGNLTIPVTFTANGSISATVTDGTNTLTANANITNVDSVIPVILTTTAKNISQQTADINVVTTENLSGIVKYMYRYGTDINAAPWTEKTSTATTIDISLTNLTQLTAYTFGIKAVDKAGNESTVKQIQFTTLEEIKFKPVITTGLTPIKWNAGNALVTTGDTDPEWFDYQNKKWANAQTKDGSMWTWIPRYAYRIIYYSGAVTDNVGSGNIVGYSDNRGLVDANGNPSTTFNRLNGRVEVVFLGADNFKYLDGTSYVGDVRLNDNTNNPNHYVVHPAFSAVRRTGYTKRADGNFGNIKEIPGFWVSKFEMGPDSVSKPNISSQRDMTISNMYAEGQKIATTRGITGGDSNAMTTTQWGAVAYLTKAMGSEPDISTNNSFISGNGNYIANANQSTTKNVTGVYDMNGCAWETMSSYVNSGTLTTGNGQNLITNKDTKYVDVYAVGSGNTQASNYAANADKYGDAQYEVSSNGVNSPTGWSGDYSHFPYSTAPVFCRGGYYTDGGTAGVFAFGYYAGQPYGGHCWRRGFHFVTSVLFFPFIYSERINTTEKIE